LFNALIRGQRKAPRKQGLPKRIHSGHCPSSRYKAGELDDEKPEQMTMHAQSKGELLEPVRGVTTESYPADGRRGRRPKKSWRRRAKKPRDSMKQEESNASGKEWLRNFSTMKFGLQACQTCS